MVNHSGSAVCETEGAIAGLHGWFEGQPWAIQDALRALGELLMNVEPSSRAPRDVFNAFVETHMGDRVHELVAERRELSSLRRIMVGLTLADWIEEYQPAVSALSTHAEVSGPRWDTVEIGPDQHHFPAGLAFYSDAIVPGMGVVVAIRPPESAMNGGRAATLTVYVRQEDRPRAVELADRILDYAQECHHVFRGRVLRAVYVMGGVQFDVVESPTVTRSDIIAAPELWAELDLNVAAVDRLSEQMRSLGLGVRRGAMLVGPPGVGKSACCAVIAAELAGRFTVVYVDARVGANALRQVFDECVDMGPSVVVIQDVDLFIGSRKSAYGGASLGEFLAALDSYPAAQLLVLATTNDVTTLDAAAVRTARFDSIIEVPPPGPAEAARILAQLLRGVPGGDGVDPVVVVAALPAQVTGADLREVVRRAVLAGEGTVNTPGLLVVARGGRFRPVMPAGSYL
ncbi:ATP-binding protein [Mycolicibacter sp. MYC123]|uniref:ATP-binding protein n=1 Tax=[Mycobacterium] zoologicum TaxID=2872311 RepID=A0ABU5YPZ4_9MYCO|nr:ATP-binding protein [Mycolicibacter sp. MYC123]MEB3052137.1 ATP-binding protein [Mycolicibacter sp. MYC123]